MFRAAFGLCAFVLLYTVKAKNVDVDQMLHLFAKENQAAEIKCSHKDSSMLNMLWYQQKNTAMELIVYLYGATGQPTYENDHFKNHFSMTKQDVMNGALKISNINLSDSAVYYCAVSMGNTGSIAYFGNGTKLTVLEPGKNITKPEVKIIEPSKKELCKKAVTLVCVAEKFYPDHVTIKWKIGNEDFTKGVATDPYAKKNNKTGMFEMSSRFKIKSNVYHNAEKTFQCIVSFYDGEGYINKTATVKGIAGKGFNKEKHMTEAATVKLAYGVFIAKSGLYGIFIFFFVRRQVSAGK